MKESNKDRKGDDCSVVGKARAYNMLQGYNDYVDDLCKKKFNYLTRTDCDGKGSYTPTPGGHYGDPAYPAGYSKDDPAYTPPAGGYSKDHPSYQPPKDPCACECVTVTFPTIEPCISVKWGDSKCDGLESDDMEVLCITVCNCYCNVTFQDFTIGHIKITDMAGNPVPCLPNGEPSVQVVPSGSICFGDICPCDCTCNKPSCVSREFVVYTCGAVAQCYLLSFEDICFTVCHEVETKQCFKVEICAD